MEWRLVRRPLTGELRGEGLVANCVVMIDQLVNPESPPVLTKLDFEWIDTKLPEGDYVLTFEDQTLDLHYAGSLWTQSPKEQGKVKPPDVKHAAS